MLNFILCEEFYPNSDFNAIRNFVNQADYVESEFGLVSAIQYIPKEAEKSIQSVLNEECFIEKTTSGKFIKKPNCLIHFENTASISQWSFIVAIEDTTFNLLHHRKTGARSALDTTELPFRNFLEWDYHLNVLLKRNQAIFYRPWLFHSIESGIIQHFTVYQG